MMSPRELHDLLPEPQSIHVTAPHLQALLREPTLLIVSMVQKTYHELLMKLTAEFVVTPVS